MVFKTTSRSMQDRPQSMAGKSLNPLCTSQFPIDIHRHDGHRPRRDGRLYLVLVDIHENRLAAVPPNGMRRSHETVRSRNHLPRYPKSLQGRKQRQGPIGKQTDIGNLQILAQGPFQLLMERPVIGNPLTVPDLMKNTIEFLETGKKRRGNCYGINHISIPLSCSMRSFMFEQNITHRSPEIPPIGGEGMLVVGFDIAFFGDLDIFQCLRR